MASKYVIADRSDGNKYAIKIDNEELFFEVSASVASAEPIFEDDTNAGTYWKLYFDDSEMAFESTVTVQDDNIQLSDPTTNKVFKLFISDGEFGYSEVDVLAIKSPIVLVQNVVRTRTVLYVDKPIIVTRSSTRYRAEAV